MPLAHGISLSSTLSMGRTETIEFATPHIPNRNSRASGVVMSNRVNSRRLSNVSSRRYPTMIDERCEYKKADSTIGCVFTGNL